MDVINIFPPDEAAGRYAVSTVDVNGIKRKFLDIPYATVSPNQKLDIYLPDEGEGPFPTIIYYHGGAFITGQRKDFSLTYMIDGIRRGYAVVSVDYRFSFECVFPEPVFDVKTAVRFLRANAEKYHLDPSRFCAVGGSAGAYFTGLIAATDGIAGMEGYKFGYEDQSSAIQAAIGLFGCYDMVKESYFSEAMPTPVDRPKMPNFSDLYMGFNCREQEELARFANPASYIRPNFPPMLVWAGTADAIVPCECSVEFAQQVNKICGEGRATLELFEGFAHSDDRFAEMENINRMFAFIDQHLK